MRHEYEIIGRLGQWNKVNLSEFEPNLVASIICELQWVLGADVDILTSNERWRAQEEALRRERGSTGLGKTGLTDEQIDELPYVKMLMAREAAEIANFAQDVRSRDNARAAGDCLRAVRHGIKEALKQQTEVSCNQGHDDANGD